MSPLLRDRLHIALYPDRVAITRHQRGWRPKMRRRHQVGISPAPGKTSWAPACDALQALLAEPRWQHAHAEFLLSDHFIRYALVPWNAAVTAAEEMAALARHQFSSIYGEPASNWTVRLANGVAGVPRLAAAMDRELLDALKSSAKSARLTVKSLRPSLVAAYNQWRHLFKGKFCCFVLSEAGRVCLCLFCDGEFRSVRNQRLRLGLEAEIAGLLQHELLSEGIAEDATVNVFVHAPGSPDFMLGSRFALHRLPPAPGGGMLGAAWAFALQEGR